MSNLSIGKKIHSRNVLERQSHHIVHINTHLACILHRNLFISHRFIIMWSLAWWFLVFNLTVLLNVWSGFPLQWNGYDKIALRNEPRSIRLNMCENHFTSSCAKRVVRFVYLTTYKILMKATKVESMVFRHIENLITGKFLFFSF